MRSVLHHCKPQSYNFHLYKEKINVLCFCILFMSLFRFYLFGILAVSSLSLVYFFLFSFPIFWLIGSFGVSRLRTNFGAIDLETSNLICHQPISRYLPSQNSRLHRRWMKTYMSWAVFEDAVLKAQTFHVLHRPTRAVAVCTAGPQEKQIARHCVSRSWYQLPTSGAKGILCLFSYPIDISIHVYTRVV